MKRFYLKQNGYAFVVNVIVSILLMTFLDWTLEKPMEVLVRINHNYMGYMSLWVILAVSATNFRYLKCLKEEREGEVYYTLPIKRKDLWLNQWIASCLNVIGTWILSGIGIAVFGRTIEIENGYLFLSVLAHIVFDIAVITLFMWFQTKGNSTLKLSGILIAEGLLVTAFLDGISKYFITYFGDKSLGVYAYIKDGLYTFLYSKQLMLLYHRNQPFYYSDKVSIQQFAWEIKGYGILYAGIMIVLCVIVLLMSRNSMKNMSFLPQVSNKLAWIKYPTIVMGSFLFTNWLFTKRFAFFGDAVEITQITQVSNGMDSIMFYPLQYYDNISTTAPTVNIRAGIMVLIVTIVMSGILLGICKLIHDKRQKRQIKEAI